MKKVNQKLSVEQYAHYCDVSKTAVYQWIAAKLISPEYTDVAGYRAMIIDTTRFPPRTKRTCGRKKLEQFLK